MAGSELELSILEAAQVGEVTLLNQDGDQQADQPKEEQPSLDSVSLHRAIKVCVCGGGGVISTLSTTVEPPNTGHFGDHVNCP